MKITITNRYTNQPIYEGKAPSLRAAVEKCVRELGISLARANLAGAYLAGAYLTGADLTRANLTDANLADANLAGANLTDAYLARAKGLNPLLTTPLYLLRDQPGPIRAYKLVTAEGVGPFNGGLTYRVGESYEVADANTDEQQSCAAGINLATLDWCLRGYRPGFRILVCEFTAADLAAIPVGSDGKFRVHRMRVVGEKSLADVGLAPADAAA